MGGSSKDFGTPCVSLIGKLLLDRVGDVPLNVVVMPKYQDKILINEYIDIICKENYSIYSYLFFQLEKK